MALPSSFFIPAPADAVRRGNSRTPRGRLGSAACGVSGFVVLAPDPTGSDTWALVRTGSRVSIILVGHPGVRHARTSFLQRDPVGSHVMGVVEIDRVTSPLVNIPRLTS